MDFTVIAIDCGSSWWDYPVFAVTYLLVTAVGTLLYRLRLVAQRRRRSDPSALRLVPTLLTVVEIAIAGSLVIIVALLLFHSVDKLTPCRYCNGFMGWHGRPDVYDLALPFLALARVWTVSQRSFGQRIRSGLTAVLVVAIVVFAIRISVQTFTLMAHMPHMPAAGRGKH